MFDFLMRKNHDSTDVLNISEKDKKNDDSCVAKIGSGYAATKTAQIATEQAAKTFAKPETYTGNRKIYDSGTAKLEAKRKLFQNGNIVTDPYTGEQLVLTKHEAKLLYGEHWSNHLAESDHVKPLERIYNETKNNVWNTTEDIKVAANSPDNIRVASRKYNNPKRSRTNKEYVEDTEYLQKKGVYITEEGKKQAILDGELADSSIRQQLKHSSFRNAAKTGHDAGMKGATEAGITALTMTGIMNIVAVLNGEKSSEEAIADTAKVGGKAAVTGYAMSSSLTVASHTLSSSSSKFIQSLSKSNVPGKIITAVIVTGETLKQWGNGELTTQECMIELGDKGLNFATMGWSMAAGQALIPIPVVGGAVGALVGSMLTSTYYHNLIDTLQTKELEHQERQKIIAECHAAAEQTKAFRIQLESYLNDYFQDYKDCFDSALSSAKFAYQTGDADGFIASANDITRKLGGYIPYENMEEFKKYMKNDSIDIL